MTPLERAALAIRQADNAGYHDAENKDYRAMARAVLQAIREPSEAMTPEEGVFAGFSHDSDGVEDNNYITSEEARYAWQAMIDAALEEG